jgi:AraC-like DNA-binding protein
MKTLEIEDTGLVDGGRPGCRPTFPGGSADLSDGLFANIEKIEHSIRYMRQHLDQPLQVARLAALVHISPSHYFALFKRRTGCAPIDFFIRLRIEQACRLLDETLMNVKEVAAVLGYDDPFYFSRTFKSVSHVAPSEYRVLSKEFKEAIRSAVRPGAANGAREGSGELRTASWPGRAQRSAAICVEGGATTAGAAPEWLENTR